MRWVQLIHAIFAWNIHMINTWNPIWAKKHPELSGFLSGMSIVMANVPWLGLVISCLGKTKLQGIPFRFCWTFFLTNLGWFMVQNKLNLHSSGLVSWVGLSLVCFAAGQWGHIVQGIRWSPYDSIVEDVHPFLKISYFSKGLVKNHQLGFDSIYFHLYGDLLRDVGICHVTTWILPLAIYRHS